MSISRIFLDSSALIAGIISVQGASHVLLILGEEKRITLFVSEQVIIEVERNVARKMPKILHLVREIILQANIRIVRDPTPDAVQQHLSWISHASDVPILLAARQANVDFLVTLNRRHFIEDPEVATRSNLRIGTPGDCLAWLRNKSEFQPGTTSPL